MSIAGKTKQPFQQRMIYKYVKVWMKELSMEKSKGEIYLENILDQLQQINRKMDKLIEETSRKNGDVLLF